MFNDINFVKHSLKKIIAIVLYYKIHFRKM